MSDIQVGGSCQICGEQYGHADYCEVGKRSVESKSDKQRIEELERQVAELQHQMAMHRPYGPLPQDDDRAAREAAIEMLKKRRDEFVSGIGHEKQQQ